LFSKFFLSVFGRITLSADSMLIADLGLVMVGTGKVAYMALSAFMAMTTTTAMTLTMTMIMTMTLTRTRSRTR
jgi:hypothetical protein